MKKIIKAKYIYTSTIIALWIFFSIPCFAQRDRRWEYGTDPIGILDKMVSDANDVWAGYRIQDTALDYVDSGPGRFRIYNTLTRIRKNITPYIQRAVYIGLTVATILLIYIGFMMVTQWVHNAGKLETLKKNLINVAIGVFILTGFYVIFQLTVAIINAIFGKTIPWI